MASKRLAAGSATFAVKSAGGFPGVFLKAAAVLRSQHQQVAPRQLKRSWQAPKIGVSEVGLPRRHWTPLGGAVDLPGIRCSTLWL